MFQFSAFASFSRCHAFSMAGCPIRKSVDQFAFADTHSLSQLITSFIASGSLGIPRVPFVTFFSPMALLLPWRCYGIWHNHTHPVYLLSLLFLPVCQRTFFGVLRSGYCVLGP